MKIPKTILLTACAAGQTCTLTNATGALAANANAVVDVACL